MAFGGGSYADRPPARLRVGVGEVPSRMADMRLPSATGPMPSRAGPAGDKLSCPAPVALERSRITNAAAASVHQADRLRVFVSRELG